METVRFDYILICKGERSFCVKNVFSRLRRRSGSNRPSLLIKNQHLQLGDVLVLYCAISIWVEINLLLERMLQNVSLR